MIDTARRGLPSRVGIRAATDDDVPGIRAVLAGHGNDGPVVIADVVGPYVRHLISRGMAQVAVDGESIVGFAAALDTGRSIQLADLFVHVDRLGQGTGGPLLDAALGPPRPRTTFASDDPRALPLYVRAGMMPLWASLYVEGSASSLPEPSRAVTTEPAQPDALAALELSWTGYDRSADHAFWATMADADLFVVRDGGEVAGFGCGRVRQQVATRVLDRLVIHPDADPVATTLAAVARAARGGPVTTCLLGPHPALRPLLETGFKVVDRDQCMASDPGLVDPTRLVPNPGML